jgi:mono/diheme cytochrome c family protein
VRKIPAVLFSLALVAVCIQFVPVRRSNPPVESDIAAPPEVKAILRASCYDCHSNETVWPWYSRVAPVSWLVGSDVSEGRSKVDFSTWNRYDPAAQARIMARLVREVGGGDMPPWYYTLKHSQARLGPAQRQVLEAWAKAR